MKHELELLLNDYNSSCTPDPNDPMTIKALDIVAINIYKGVYTKRDFIDFTKTKLGDGYFAKACKEYVLNIIKENE